MTNTIFTAVDSFKSILEIVRCRMSMIFASRAIWFRILVIPNPVSATCCSKSQWSRDKGWHKESPFIKEPAAWEDGGLRSQRPFNISVPGNGNGEWRKPEGGICGLSVWGCQSSQSAPITILEPVKWWSVFSYPGFIVKGQKISWNQKTWRLESASLEVSS